MKKHELEQATGVTLKNIRRCVAQMSGQLVKTINISPRGQIGKCRINSHQIQSLFPGSEIWYGYRIYPNNGKSTDPDRSIQKAQGHICFEEHFVVKTPSGDFLCSTPGKEVVDDYEFWYVAVEPADPMTRDFEGNFEYTNSSGLNRVPYIGHSVNFYNNFLRNPA